MTTSITNNLNSFLGKLLALNCRCATDAAKAAADRQPPPAVAREAVTA